MVLEISKDILDKTKKCAHNFKCLEDVKWPACKAEYAIKDCSLFVEPNKDCFCSYSMMFGFSHLCDCPTRAEIYKKYNK